MERSPCGCEVVARGDLRHFYPCSEQHRTVARMSRSAGSSLIVHEVRK